MFLENFGNSLLQLTDKNVGREPASKEY